MKRKCLNLSTINSKKNISGIRVKKSQIVEQKFLNYFRDYYYRSDCVFVQKVVFLCRRWCFCVEGGCKLGYRDYVTGVLRVILIVIHAKTKTGPFHTYILAYFSTLNYHNLLRMTSIEGLGIPGSANTQRECKLYEKVKYSHTSCYGSATSFIYCMPCSKAIPTHQNENGVTVEVLCLLQRRPNSKLYVNNNGIITSEHVASLYQSI